MQNQQLIGRNRIEDEIGIARKRHDPHVAPLRQQPAAAGKFAEQIDCSSNSRLDGSRRRCIAFSQIIGDGNKIFSRAWTEANLHFRNRRNAASTSASLANSPRCTWAKPSSIAASSSALAAYVAPNRSSASSISAASSWRGAGQRPMAANAFSSKFVMTLYLAQSAGRENGAPNHETRLVSDNACSPAYCPHARKASSKARLPGVPFSIARMARLPVV